MTPLDVGSGIASPALVTYKRQEGASETQVCINHLQGDSSVQASCTVVHAICMSPYAAFKTNFL